MSNACSCEPSPGEPGATSRNFVAPVDNWLPPGQLPGISDPTIASRTSPTNIGMALLANLAAYDLGYLSQQSCSVANGEHAGDDGEAGTLSRPSLQLVRHPHAATAPSAVRLVGGQRQPGRQPAHAAGRAGGAEGTPGLPSACVSGAAGHIAACLPSMCPSPPIAGDREQHCSTSQQPCRSGHRRSLAADVTAERHSTGVRRSCSPRYLPQTDDELHVLGAGIRPASRAPFATISVSSCAIRNALPTGRH